MNAKVGSAPLNQNDFHLVWIIHAKKLGSLDIGIHCCLDHNHFCAFGITYTE